MQTAIGQGNTLVSPMHMALITCAIANDGVLMKPYLIDEVVNDNGDSVKKTEPVAYKRLMSSDVYKRQPPGLRLRPSLPADYQLQ